MTTEERLGTVEHSIQHHDAIINLLTTMQEHQKERIELSEQRLELSEQRLEEARHDSAMTRRLWVHLARKNGWLEDEDWPPPQA